MPAVEGAWHDHTWNKLSELDPTDVCQRSLVIREGSTGFTVPFLSTSYQIDCERRIVSGAQGTPRDEIQLVLLNYLIGASSVPLGLKWVNERALAGGELFFNGPHGLPVSRLCDRFGRDREAFLRGGRSIGGEPMEFGDASLRLQPLPRIPLVCILWEADDEFPARASYLFDPTTDAHLALDAILGMVKCVGEELISAADTP